MGKTCRYKGGFKQNEAVTNKQVLRRHTTGQFRGRPQHAWWERNFDYEEKTKNSNIIHCINCNICLIDSDKEKNVNIIHCKNCDDFVIGHDVLCHNCYKMSHDCYKWYGNVLVPNIRAYKFNLDICTCTKHKACWECILKSHSYDENGELFCNCNSYGDYWDCIYHDPSLRRLKRMLLRPVKCPF